MKKLFLLGLLIVLYISGYAGIGHGPGERKGDTAKGKIHGMNKGIVPELVGTWKLINSL
jgi:hypothetical protein